MFVNSTKNMKKFMEEIRASQNDVRSLPYEKSNISESIRSRQSRVQANVHKHATMRTMRTLTQIGMLG